MALPSSTSGTAPAVPAADKREHPHWDVAKWLIPSVTALFVIVGYVAARGHYSLLGFDPGFLGTTEYSSITAEFLVSVIDSTLDGAESWLYVVATPRLLLAAAPAVLVCVLLTYISREPTQTPVAGKPGRLRGSLALLRRRADRHLAFRKPTFVTLMALLVVVLLKGMLLDAPTFKLEGALLTLSDSSTPGDAPFPLHARLERQATEGGVSGIAASSARVVWRDLMCQRVDAQALRNSTAGLQCNAARASYAHRTEAEFLANLVATACVAWLAILLLSRAERVLTVSVAWLALLYCLTLPYSYGKLIRSTEYQFGEIALKTQVDFATNDVNRRLINGFEIVRDSGTATIATLRVVECGPGKSRQDVKLWRVALGEILWYREIYRDDILGWKLVKERDDCPSNKVD